MHPNQATLRHTGGSHGVRVDESVAAVKPSVPAMTGDVAAFSPHISDVAAPSPADAVPHIPAVELVPHVPSVELTPHVPAVELLPHVPAVELIPAPTVGASRF